MHISEFYGWNLSHSSCKNAFTNQCTTHYTPPPEQSVMNLFGSLLTITYKSLPISKFTKRLEKNLYCNLLHYEYDNNHNEWSQNEKTDQSSNNTRHEVTCRSHSLNVKRTEDTFVSNSFFEIQPNWPKGSHSHCDHVVHRHIELTKRDFFLNKV